MNVTYTNNIEDQLNTMLESLNLVIVVLIISAGLLAFVVLYNLNNINITERRRELATLKVLGFYDAEVSSYVYRGEYHADSFQYCNRYRTGGSSSSFCDHNSGSGCCNVWPGSELAELSI